MLNHFGSLHRVMIRHMKLLQLSALGTGSLCNDAGEQGKTGCQDVYPSAAW